MSGFSLNNSSMYGVMSPTHLQGENRVAEIIAGNLVPYIFASLFFFARVYSRGYLLRSWGYDDSFLVLSWLGATGLVVASCVSTRYGTGYHINDIPLRFYDFLIPGLQISFAALVIYQFTTALTKLSLCFLYLRIFVDKTTRCLIYGMFGWVILYTVPITLFGIFQCLPVASQWDVIKYPGVCVTKSTIPFFIQSTCNIIADVVLLAIVVPRIWALQMPTRQKLALSMVVTLSWIAVAAAILRMVRTAHYFKTNSLDSSWTFFDLSIWSDLEINMTIFCISAPGSKPILQRIAPNFLTNISESISISHPSFGFKKPSFADKSSKSGSSGSKGSRWLSQNGKAIQLSDREIGDLGYPGPDTSNPRKIWGKSRTGDDGIVDDDSQDGVLRTMEKEGDEEADVRDICKTTTLQINVAGRPGCSKECKERGQHAARRQSSLGTLGTMESLENLEGKPSGQI